jgi:hypothetical protein
MITIFNEPAYEIENDILININNEATIEIKDEEILILTES